MRPSGMTVHPVPGVRPPSVAGMFYPASPGSLRGLVVELFDAASRIRAEPVDPRTAQADPLGLLVPHAGLVYSGVTAAAAWSSIAARPQGAPPVPLTVVLLGTNHFAARLDGVAAWPAGAWTIPGGELAVDAELAGAIVALGAPFLADPDAHAGEHSLEVQLPLLHAADPAARIVPLSVAAGVGTPAIEAGTRLGDLLGRRLAADERIVLAISSDMAHYPPAGTCEWAIDAMLPAILGLDPAGLARRELDLRESGARGLDCGMCGIEPAVLGLAALRAMGVRRATVLAASTSADAGGPSDRTVGYLAVRFDA